MVMCVTTADGNRELGWSGRLFLSMWSGGLDLGEPSEDPRATRGGDTFSVVERAAVWPTAAGFVKCSGSCGDRNRSPEARKSRSSPRGESRRRQRTDFAPKTSEKITGKTS
jgi:hypothetical protein